MGFIALEILTMTPSWLATAQVVTTTTVQGTVYEANGSAGAGTLDLSWPAFATAGNQAVAAGRMTVPIAPDGFISVNLTPNLGATPAGLYYTAVYHMSDGTTSTEYWVVPAAAQASLGQVRAQVMPAAQAVQAVSKAYVDQSLAELAESLITVNGGTMTGPLYLSEDPTQSMQAADKHYVDASAAKAVPLAGGNMTGALTAPAVNGVESPAAGSSQTTLQAAISAAGAAGALQIPPTYTGTDGFTNPNGIYVNDLRSTVAQQSERSVKEFGAVCDGTTDDTTALQAAINYAEVQGVALTIPQGTCKTRTLIWHGESIGGLGRQVSALMGFPGQDVLATVPDTTNMLSNTHLHDLTIYVDQSVDVSCSAAKGRAPAGSCTANRPLEVNSVFSPGGNGLTGTVGAGTAWAIGNCAIAMAASTGIGGNGLRVAEIENVEIAATGVDPMAQYAGAHSTHTCGMYLEQWPQWSEFRNIDIRGVNTGIAIPALPVTTPAGLNADSNSWRNITIQAAHGFVAGAGSNNVLDNVVSMVSNSAATSEPPTGLVLDFAGSQQGWTVRNAVVLPTWDAVKPTLTVVAAGGAVTAVAAGPERGLGFDPYGTQVPLAFSGSCTAQAVGQVNMDGSIGTITVTQGGSGCSGTTTATINVAGTWNTAAPVNLVSGQNMSLFAGNLLKGNGGYTVWTASASQSFGTQLDGGGGALPGGGTYSALVGSNQIGNAYPVDQFPGSDFGAKLQACVNAVSSAYGGACDARNFTGSLSMGSNLTISTANTSVLLPCATISTANQLIVTAGTRNVTLRGCALRGTSKASGSQGGTVFLYSGANAMIQVGDPTYAADTQGFHLDDVTINTTASSKATAQALAAYRTQEMDLESLYFLGNSNQTGMTLDGTGNYTGGTFLDNALSGFQTAVNALGHQVSNAATTDWLNASTFVRLHIDCPTSGGNPIAGTYGINLQQGDGNTFTGGDVEGCDTALHLGGNAQNNTIVGLRNENSNSQVVAEAGSSYNSWMTGGTMFTGKLTDSGTRNSFLDTFHRSFNGMNGDWYGSQKDATITNHYRIGIGAGNERGLLDRFQTDYGYRWTMGLSDATAGQQYYQILDELNNVYRLSIGQYNNGYGSTNNQTVINAAGTGAVVLNGSNNSGTGGVVFGSGGPSENTVATISNTGSAQFNGTLQVGGTSTFVGTPTVKNQADSEIDAILWSGLTTSQKESFIYKDFNGNSQWYMVKDASNNWALNSATGGLDSFKAYQSTNSGDTYIDASNPTGVVRVNYETGSGSGFNIYGGGSNSLYASFTGTSAIKFPGLAASSGHNCLQIDNSGYITNTGAACAAGGGGGTINSGTSGQIAYYTQSGTILGGVTTVPVSAGGTGASTASSAMSNLLPGVSSDAAAGILVTGNVAAAGMTASQVLGVNSLNPPATNLPGAAGLFAAKPEYLNSTAYFNPPAAPAWGTVAHQFQWANFFESAPGFSRGNQPVGQGGWSSVFMHEESLQDNTPGSAEMINPTLTHTGVGDTNVAYLYGWCYGGTTAGSDEGCKILGANGGESSTTYQGTVTAGGTGATTIKTACTSDCGNQGDGRYLIDKANSTGTSKALAAGYVTAITQPSGFTPGAFTSSVAVTPSSAWGTLVSDVATAIGSPAGITYTPETFTVNVLNGNFNTSELLCFAGQFHEQVRATSVTAASGGQQTITVSLRQPHEAGSWLMQGGPCGTLIDFTANQTTVGSTVLRYPVPIIGATDSNTLIYRWFSAASGQGVSYRMGNILLGQHSMKTLTNTSGTVTMLDNAGGINSQTGFLNAPMITISGATDSAFNGPCTNTLYNQSTGYFTCTQSGSIGHTAATATIAVGDTPFGNADFTLWPSAEVIDVQNEAQTPPTVDGTLTVEPNNVAWSVGDVVEEPHHYAAILAHTRGSIAYNNPTVQDVGILRYSVSGAGAIGAGPTNVSSAHGALAFENNNPSTMYQYFGGNAYPMGGVGLMGTAPWGYGFMMKYAPEQGGYGTYLGAPLSGVSDPNYSYMPLATAGQRGVDGFKFTPSTDESDLIAGNCTFMFATTGLSSNCNMAAQASALVGTSLPSTVVTSSLSSVGTITSGTWNGTPIDNAHLANSSVTVNGATCALGGTCTVSQPGAIVSLCHWGIPGVNTGNSGSYIASTAFSPAIPSCTIPAGTMGTASTIKLEAQWDACNGSGTPFAGCAAANTGTCTIRAYLNSSNAIGGLQFISPLALTAHFPGRETGKVSNQNSLTAQVGSGVSWINGGSASFSPTSNGTINTAATSYIVFAVENSVSTDQCGLISYDVEMLP
jgi:hypothetical protein